MDMIGVRVDHDEVVDTNRRPVSPEQRLSRTSRRDHHSIASRSSRQRQRHLDPNPGSFDPSAPLVGYCR